MVEHVFKDVQITLKNFEGKPKQNNPIGAREFYIVLTSLLAEELTQQGWSIDLWSSDECTALLRVAIGARHHLPKIVMVSSNNSVALTREDCKILDSENVTSCDVVIGGYDWAFEDKKGRKAYVEELIAKCGEEGNKRE